MRLIRARDEKIQLCIDELSSCRSGPLPEVLPFCASARIDTAHEQDTAFAGKFSQTRRVKAETQKGRQVSYGSYLTRVLVLNSFGRSVVVFLHGDDRFNCASNSRNDGLQVVPEEVAMPRIVSSSIRRNTKYVIYRISSLSQLNLVDITDHTV